MFASLLLGTLAAYADIDMIPEDGTCLPGETVQVFAPEPDTGEGWTCVWSVDEGLGEAPEGGFGEIVCPTCGERVEDWNLTFYTVCTDVHGTAQWEFDDIVVRCSEVEPEEEAPEGCACGAAGAASLAWLLVVPVVWSRRRSP